VSVLEFCTLGRRIFYKDKIGKEERFHICRR